MADKFIQPPDADSTGMSVLFSQYATYFRKLADDWTCTETGEISKATLWVSFIDDALPQGGLAEVRISVHADAPADSQNPRSRPGSPLAQWVLGPSEFALMPHAGPVSGKFWDPILGQREMGIDTQIWRLDCFIPEGTRFLQREGETYWLGAFVVTGDGGATLCGWKTCPGAGAAAWTDDPQPGPPSTSWTTMQHPAWHLRPGTPLELAFAIETAPPAAPPAMPGRPAVVRTAPPAAPPAMPGRSAARPPAHRTGQPIEAFKAAAPPPPAPVSHPADAGPGVPSWRCQPAEILACAAKWQSGATLEFQGVPLDNSVAQAYILRAAAIALAHYQARYEDAGSAAPIDSALHPQRWRELPDL